MTTNQEHGRSLLDLRREVSPHPRVHYLQHEFEVPGEVQGLKVTLRFRKERRCQLFLSVFGPDGYRGTRMNPAAVGDVELELSFGTLYSSPGALAGPIKSGIWRAQIDVEGTDETTQYHLTVREHAGDATPKAPPEATRNGHAGHGWYRGELHAHTHHSDGKPTPAQLTEAARQYQLDYLALTDHFTPAGWPEIEALADEKLAVIRSLELTGHRGHANLHGLKDWVNVFVDDPDEPWSVNDVARAVRAQGGLFCVNHAFSNRLGWRYHEFDWSLCDAYEIYHQLEGSNNAAQLSFWDSLLRAGRRITGVAGTDSHDPHSGRHRLGQAVTVIKADSLTPAGLLDGLKAGRAYVSLGPTLAFEAHAGGEQAEMGGELPCAAVVLRIQVTNLQYPTRLFVLKNGLYHTHLDLAASSGTDLEFRDPDPVPGYYRVEAYALALQSDEVGGREWQNTLLLSNPIYVRQDTRGDQTP